MVTWCHVTNEKCYIYTIGTVRSQNLSSWWHMVQRAPANRFTWPLNKMVLRYHVTNKIDYILTFRKPMNTKLDKVLTYRQRLPLLKPHRLWSNSQCEVTQHFEKSISSLSQDLRSLNLEECWLQGAHSIRKSWSCQELLFIFTLI